MTDHSIFASSPSFSSNPEILDRLKKLNIPFTLNTVGEKYTETSLAEHCSELNNTILIVGLEPVTRESLLKMKQLKFLAKFGVGLDNIDIKALQEMNIGLGWSPGVNKRSVSELVLSFALSHQRNVYRSIQLLREGKWIKNGGRQLSNSIVGIVGFGNVGQDLASLLKPFGCRILVNDVFDKKEEIQRLGVEKATLEQILEHSDIVSLNVPSTPLTQNFVNASFLDKCKNDALIINTSRGDIVSFEAIVKAVQENKIGGYSADVFPSEPCDLSDVLRDTRFQFTPHIGGNAFEAVVAMGHSAIEHIQEFLTTQN